MRLLHQLAHLCGVQTDYFDVTGRRQVATAESLIAVLRSLGAPVETLQDVPSAWRARRQALWQRLLEPVIVAWGQRLPTMEVRLPDNGSEARLVGHLRLETGEEQSWEWLSGELPVVKSAKVEGGRYVVRRLSLPRGLPYGYHRFTLESAGGVVESLIVSAPVKAHLPARGMGRDWGVFLPLYALHTERSWGAGDFSDLARLIDWASDIGGCVVATLPFLAATLDEPTGPSPYSPISRLMWNEFYIDITKVPELQRCSPAQSRLTALPFQEEIESLRRLPLVDYRRQMALKRQILEELCRCCFAEDSGRLESLRQFAKANPEVEDYARFRATWEKRGSPWPSWPEPLRQGALSEGDYDEGTKRYHLYVQWLASQQIESLSAVARAKGMMLYLDLPVGVHPDGYDVWRRRASFAVDASVGAPPDAVFTKGQNWSTPPLHPEKIREQGYQYVIAYLRHHLQHSGILRVDHVMGLHRLFWIPKGLEANDGVYVRYRAEEMHAILTLESYRSKVVIAGEDLGTVPPEVRTSMTRHGLYRTYVLHYQLASGPQAVQRVPRNSVASLNTHDMPLFAAFWRDLDIQERLRLGILGAEGARQELEHRKYVRPALANFLRERGWMGEFTLDSSAVLKGCLAWLSASPARVVLVNLEDLWLETQSQNVPGAGGEHPNWRRKASYSFETFCQMPQVLDMLLEVDRLRRRHK